MNVLEQVIEVIERQGWQQGPQVFTASGHCMLTALHEVTKSNWDLFDPAYNALLKASGGNITAFNDAPGRTVEEVLEALRVASKDLS